MVMQVCVATEQAVPLAGPRQTESPLLMLQTHWLTPSQSPTPEHVLPQLCFARHVSPAPRPALQTALSQVSHGPQSAFVQQPASGMHVPPQAFVPGQHEPAGRHFLPHLTFGALHFFFFFSASASP